MFIYIIVVVDGHVGLFVTFIHQINKHPKITTIPIFILIL